MKPNQYDPAEQKFQALETEEDLIKQPVPSATEIAPGIEPIWYDRLAELNLRPPIWVVDKIIPASSITIISAPPSQYKTWLALDIAIKVASGKPVFGHFETKQTKVLIIDEESGLVLARERLKLLGVTNSTPLAVTSLNNYILDEAKAKSLVVYCNTYGIGLVIFDSLTRIHNGEENSAKDMSVVMGNLKRLAQAGIAVLLIHHNRKPGQFTGGGANEMRGSGDILAACDVQISAKRSGSIVTVTQNKNRNAEELPAFDLEFHIDENMCRFEYRGNALKRPGKTERTDDAIRELLADNKPRFKEQIIGALKGIEDVGGEQMIPKRLKALLDAGEITFTQGANNKHFYRLLREQTNE